MKERRPGDPTGSYGGGSGTASVPGKRTLIDATYGSPTRVASAPEHKKHHAHAKASSGPPQSQQQFNAIFKVVAYKNDGTGEHVVKTWGANGRWEGPLPQTFEGSKSGSAWTWSGDDAHSIRVNASPDGHGGESLEIWGAHVHADRIVVYAEPIDAVTVANDQPKDDKAPGRATDAKDAGDGSSEDVNAGSVKRAGSGDGGGSPDGTGEHASTTAGNGTGAVHRDGKDRGGEEGTPDGADQTGKSGHDDHDGNSTRTIDGKDGGTIGSAHTDGGTDGHHDSDSDARSLVHNDKAERGDAPNANIPGDGGKQGGRAGGDENKGDGGVAGGMAVWKVIPVPAAIAPLVELGIILKQADIAGVTDGIVSKAAQGIEGAALRTAIEEDVDRYAASEVARVESELSAAPEWQQLDEATRASKAAEMKQAIRDGALNEVDIGLDEKIDELEGEVQGAKQVTDPDAAEVLGDEARADLDATEKSLNEMQAVEEKAKKAAKKRGNRTRTGIERRNASDWREVRDGWDKAGYGEALSAENRKLIAQGRVPHVDDAWIEHFPGDAALKGEPISIHHIKGGVLNVPLPASRHLDAHMPGGFRNNPGGPGRTGSLEPGKMDSNATRVA